MKLSRIFNKIKLITSRNIYKDWTVKFVPKFQFSMLLNLDSFIDYNIFVSGSYDEETLQKLEGFVRSYTDKKLKPVFFDIGSNIGLMSLYLRKQFSDLPIHAFEPVSKNFYHNKMNGIISGLNYNLYQLVIGGEENQEIKIYLPDKKNDFDYYKLNMGISSIFTNKSRSGNTFEVCKMTTFDKFTEENCKDIDFENQGIVLKIDVEGAELEVIKGMEKSLEKFRNASFVIECLFQDNLNVYGEVVKLLVSKGYSFTDYNGNALNPSDLSKLKSDNYIFKKGI